MTTTRSLLPGILAEIAGIGGIRAALRTARLYGGRRVYLPSPEYLPSTHPFAVALGHDLAKRVLTEILPANGGAELEFPLGPSRHDFRRRRRILKRLRAGASVAAIAEELGISTATVYRHRRSAKGEHRPC